MKNYAGQEVKLVDPQGNTYIVGDKVTSFRGETDEIRYIEPPHKPSASGKVNGYYAGVYGLKFVEVEHERWPEQKRDNEPGLVERKR